MHASALETAARFVSAYVKDRKLKIVDIGAQDVNGSLKEVVPEGCEYLGVDFVPGPGVDVILDDPYHLPFEDNSLDVILSSSVFEHSEFFWLLFLEILRVLKPEGLFYLSVPSNGVFHRYPVDCWRFYPDSGVALANWAKRNGVNAAVLESFTCDQMGGVWNDFVAVFVKDETHADSYPDRIVNSWTSFTNGLSRPDLDKFISQQASPEDQRRRLVWRVMQSAKARLAKFTR